MSDLTRAVLAYIEAEQEALQEVFDRMRHPATQAGLLASIAKLDAYKAAALGVQ